MRLRSIVFGIIVFSLLAGPAVIRTAAAREAAELFEKKCSTCHSIDRPKSKNKTPAQWQATVLRMKKHGADLTDAEVRTIVDYLAKNYPKK